MIITGYNDNSSVIFLRDSLCRIFVQLIASDINRARLGDVCTRLTLCVVLRLESEHCGARLSHSAVASANTIPMHLHVHTNSTPGIILTGMYVVSGTMGASKE